VFLNHAIGEGCRHRPGHEPWFIDECVFPDSEIPPIESGLASAATAGFEVRDVENPREPPACQDWCRRDGFPGGTLTPKRRWEIIVVDRRTAQGASR